MDVSIPESVSLNRATEDQLEQLGPFGVVTAIHNEDRHNGDISWYAVCAANQAFMKLYSQDWVGGPYAAAWFPCPDKATAEQVKEALVNRDWAASERRLAHERAVSIDSLDDYDTIDLVEIFGEQGVENLYRR